MANQSKFEAAVALMRRKEVLVAEGAVLRSGLSSAQQGVKTRLGAESLVRSTITQVAMAVFAAFKSRAGLASVGLPAILPLLVGGVSAFSRSALFKPVLRIGLGLLAVGAVVGIVAKRKKAAAIKRGETHRR